jgi:hypothetical protein
VESFLAYNHPKNPILEVKALRMDARTIAEHGPAWDGRSCLVVRFAFREDRPC